MTSENEQSLSDRIDVLCDRLESDLKSGKPTKVEDFLEGFKGDERSELLRHLLAVEIDFRKSCQEDLTVQEYVDRFPEETELIREILEAADPQHTVIGTTDPAKADTVDLSMAGMDDTVVPGKPDSSASAEQGGKRFGDYELLHEIARGGMGVVYKARQTKLNRIVALKMIRSGELAGVDEIQRFHTEAEAAAQLDHPNIVPIYEVGEQNGLHFFSMGFVEGKGLDARLKDGPLPPREAAELIKTIAEAIQYAHDKGIVHRDLKPANVLIDADGKPRITDFGLAKNIAGNSDMTATGQVMGTPSYMPPEQAAGKTDEIGPLADVYSLGAVLYALLTGRPPFQAANVMETLKQVCEQEPVSPRVLNAAVDKDLETVCLKTLEKEPTKRYASAGELSADLISYLERRPIVARPVGRLEHFRRWCARNRALATMGGVALILLITLSVGGPLVALQQADLRYRADQETARADRTVSELNLANQKLTDTLSAERSANRRANQNLDLADKVVEQFITEVGAEGGTLSLHPGTQPVRMKLLNMGRRYYEQLIAENKGAHLSPRLVEANSHLAFIQAKMTNNKDAAINSYQQAISLLEQERNVDADSKELRSQLGALYHNLGALFREMGRPTEGKRVFVRALQFRKQLQTENPVDAEYRDDLASSYHVVGVLHDDERNFAEALAAYRQALAIREQLAKEHATNSGYKLHLADTHHNIGWTYSQSGKTVLALREYEKSVAIKERLVHGDSFNVEYRSSLANTYHNMGLLYLRMEKPTDALEANKKALTIRERLVRENPAVADFRAELANTQSQIGVVYRGIRKYAIALTHQCHATEHFSQIVQENPKVIRYQLELARAYHGESNTYNALGKRSEAIAACKHALSVLEQLPKSKSSEHNYDLAVVLATLAEMYSDDSRMERAIQLFHRALTILEELHRTNPLTTQIRYHLAGCHYNFARILRENGKLDDAIVGFGRAISLLNEEQRRDPKDLVARTLLRKTHGNRALSFELLGNYSMAAEDWSLALKLSEPNYRFFNAMRLSLSLANTGDYSQASRLASQLSPKTNESGQLLLFACVYGLCASAADADKALPINMRHELRSQFSDSAMLLLNRIASSRLFFAPSGKLVLSSYRELDSLRNRADFQRLCRNHGIHSYVIARKPR